MKTDYAGLFGRMCDFTRSPPLLFCIPELRSEQFHRFVSSHAPVEVVVPDLDACRVPEKDLERIRWAVEAALRWD